MKHGSETYVRRHDVQRQREDSPTKRTRTEHSHSQASVRGQLECKYLNNKQGHCDRSGHEEPNPHDRGLEDWRGSSGFRMGRLCAYRVVPKLDPTGMGNNEGAPKGQGTQRNRSIHTTLQFPHVVGVRSTIHCNVDPDATQVKRKVEGVQLF